MHRIDSDGHLANHWSEGDPVGPPPVPPTTLSADWLEDVQENLVETILDAGITLVKGEGSQLLEAIQVIASRIAGASGNLLLNGGFDIWQASKNTPPSFDIGDSRPDTHQSYTADQWFARLGTNGIPGRGTITRVAVSPGAGITSRSGEFKLEWVQVIGASGGLEPYIENRIEGLEQFDNQQLTISVFADVAASTLALTPYIRQNFGSGGSADVTTTASAWTVTTTPGRYQATITVPSASGKTVGAGAYLAVGFKAPTSSTFTVRLQAAVCNRGSIPFDFVAVPYSDTLARCQRYYWKTWDPETPILTVTTVGAVPCDEGTTQAAGLNIRLPVQMRVVPTITWVAPNNGATGAIERPATTQQTVTSTQNTSTGQTGAPTTSGSSATDSLAHCIADARL